MGDLYGIECATCDYRIEVIEGVDMLYATHNVFYGRSDDPAQNRSTAFSERFYKDGKPLLPCLVEDERINDAAFRLLSEGATPDGHGHELYFCPKCNRLENRFYFKLKTAEAQYEPDYQCPICGTPLRRIRTKSGKNGQVLIVYKNNRRIDWKCPECGCNKLVYSDVFGMWD